MPILCTKCGSRRILTSYPQVFVGSKRLSVSASMSAKRRDAPLGSLSPPSTKRKIESNTTVEHVRTAKSVANFFKPSSKKEPDKVTWRTVNDSLLVARYMRNHEDESERRSAQRKRIAAFDLDGTITKTASGNVHSRGGTDWRWWDPGVPSALRGLDNDGFQLVILSNQGGISLKGDPKTVKSDKKRLADFKERVGSILTQLDIPMSVYAATDRDQFRKPRTGMWKEMLEDYDLDVNEGADLTASIFVGDAGGRIADKAAGLGVDFASSDRDFAENAGIKFQSPEEFFRNEPPRAYERKFDPKTIPIRGKEKVVPAAPLFERKNDQDVVLLCGSPASGKSTFYWTNLEPLGYERVNQDILKTRDKCLKKAKEVLVSGQSVAVDNTNADIETRKHWIELAQSAKVPVRCVWLRADARLCEHNDAVRALNLKVNPENRTILPRMAFTGFASRFKEPTLAEGFQEIIAIDFEFTGTEEQRSVWSKFWV